LTTKGRTFSGETFI
jgi:hypothetical protein